MSQEEANLIDENQKNHQEHAYEEESVDVSEHVQNELPDEEAVSEVSAVESEALATEDEDKQGLDLLEDLKKELLGITDPELKLEKAVAKMEQALSQGGIPQFRSFWEIRKMCLEFFKENISPNIRGVLWPKYSDLSKEARRLKEIFDEQSAYAVQQIGIAITALEEDVANIEEQLAKMPDVDFEFDSFYLQDNLELYNRMQRKLNLLNTYAARVNTMRKELTKTDMRIRNKNKFFQRLSVIGDKIFPERKDLIKELSDTFNQDVDNFINAHFSSDNYNVPVFKLRGEIKALQGIAKILTLNTQAFTSTRKRLSECWDKLKIVDKEIKKERGIQREVFKKNSDEVLAKMAAFKEEFDTGSLSMGSANKKLDEIADFMRAVDLGRDEIRDLKDKLTELRKPLREKAQIEEEARLKEEQARQNEKIEKLNALKEGIKTLIETAHSTDGETLEEARKNYLEEIEQSPIHSREKKELERALKPLKDIISDKKEEALLSLSEGDKEALSSLKNILKQRRERRKEIKTQLDDLRKQAGSSGLDFEKAMQHNVLINEEKERLEKIDLGIEEIEEKIASYSKP